MTIERGHPWCPLFFGATTFGDGRCFLWWNKEPMGDRASERIRQSEMLHAQKGLNF